MALNSDQKIELQKPLSRGNVKGRKQGGRNVSYIEGWHAIAEANRIFGFDGWSRETVEIKCVSEKDRTIGESKTPGHGVTYICRVRIEAAGIIRDGCGSGHGIDRDLGQAHESAIKEAECVPISTKILTQSGFKLFSDLTVGEMVAGYDLEKSILIWTPLNDVVRYDGVSVVRIKNHRTFDVICTPDHDWVAISGARSRKSEFSGIKTSEAILCASPMYGDGSLSASADDAARIGFAICDGTFRLTTKGEFSSFTIYQSKPDTVDWCRNMYGPYASREVLRDTATGETPNGYSRAGNYPAYLWDIPAADSQRWLLSCGARRPEDLVHSVAMLSYDARVAMLNAMMAADGTNRGVFSKKRKPWILDVFRTLCALNGIYTGVTRKTKAADMPVICQQKKPVVTAWNCRQESAGTADVWCPKTGTGTWVAQFENGVTCITGNTDAMKRALMTFGNQFGLALYDKEQTNVQDEPEPDWTIPFMKEAKAAIVTFKDEPALRAWWSSDAQKTARREVGLNPDQVKSLLDDVGTHIKAIQTGKVAA